MEQEFFGELIHRLRDISRESRAVEAAAELQRVAGEEDIPRLVDLLEDESFFVREAAAWPLSDLGVTSALPHLLEALERGVREGHDNDGLLAAIADLVAAQPKEAEPILRDIASRGPENLRKHAVWALDFFNKKEDV